MLTKRQSAAGILLGLCLFSRTGRAQSLAPRAYVIVPTDSNAVTLTYGLYTGSVLLDSAVPIEGAHSRASVPILSYYHTFGVFGRFANITASLPYSTGNYSGQVGESAQSIYRSGLMDSACRLSINLAGGPAMAPGQFMKWRQKTVVGVSVIVFAPTGQYDPARLVNPGSNRWAFKPELGLSRRSKQWLFDAYTSGWFFTTNHQFYPGKAIQKESWIGGLEMHLSYDIKPRMWFSLDGNYWFGGTNTTNGVEQSGTRQANSRLGATASVPLSRHHSAKVSYSLGALTRFGGDFQNLSVAWQYSWNAKAK